MIIIRTIYLVDIRKIDYAFMDKDLETIQFELFQNYPIIKDKIVMDINTIHRFKESIEKMLELRKEKESRIKNQEVKGNVKHK